MCKHDGTTVVYLPCGDALVKAPNGKELYLSRETIIALYKGPERKLNNSTNVGSTNE